jgi:hypothetical protein
MVQIFSADPMTTVLLLLSMHFLPELWKISQMLKASTFASFLCELYNPSKGLDCVFKDVSPLELSGFLNSPKSSLFRPLRSLQL